MNEDDIRYWTNELERLDTLSRPYVNNMYITTVPSYEDAYKMRDLMVQTSVAIGFLKGAVDAKTPKKKFWNRKK